MYCRQVLGTLIEIFGPFGMRLLQFSGVHGSSGSRISGVWDNVKFPTSLWASVSREFYNYQLAHIGLESVPP